MNQRPLWMWLVAPTLALFIGACSSSKPPGCAEPETLATAKLMVVDDTTKYLGGEFSDDPDGWIRKFFDGMTVGITGIGSEGYKADAKKQRERPATPHCAAACVA